MGPVIRDHLECKPAHHHYSGGSDQGREGELVVEKIRQLRVQQPHREEDPGRAGQKEDLAKEQELVELFDIKKKRREGTVSQNNETVFD